MRWDGMGSIRIGFKRHGIWVWNIDCVCVYVFFALDLVKVVCWMLDAGCWMLLDTYWLDGWRMTRPAAYDIVQFSVAHWTLGIGQVYMHTKWHDLVFFFLFF